MSVQIIRGNALALPLADESVDLVVTSPPYFGLRSYQDGGEHYAGQIGSEATPAEFLDALIAATAEMARCLKPSGSIFVNLGDKYAGSFGSPPQSGFIADGTNKKYTGAQHRNVVRRDAIPTKSLMLIPERYRIRCVDELGLIARAVIVWSKPNGLPESVTDRVRRSHEDWVHLTKRPRYYSAIDEIREEHARSWGDAPNGGHTYGAMKAPGVKDANPPTALPNPLGKLPGSVWTIATEPLRVPEELGIDHFAAFPTEWPRRIISGWSPREVCTACGEGRRPVSVKDASGVPRTDHGMGGRHTLDADHFANYSTTTGERVTPWATGVRYLITGETCACGTWMYPSVPAAASSHTAPNVGTFSQPNMTECAPLTRPGVVLDPFGGTGTTALVATALGRHGISVDMSADYCRLAQWRTTDPKQLAKAARKPYEPPREQVTGQAAFEFGEATA